MKSATNCLAFIMLFSMLSPTRGHTQNNDLICYYDQGDTLRVFSLSGLRLRAAPGSESESLGTLPFGAEVVVLEYSDRSGVFEQIPGRWLKVAWMDKQGYVFDGFLSRLPAPDKSVSDIPAYISRYKDQMAHHDLDARQDQESWEAANGEAHGHSNMMTIPRGSCGKEMYLLLKVIFRDLVEESAKDVDFRFALKGKDHTFELDGGVFLSYGQCIHGAYLRFDYGD